MPHGLHSLLKMNSLNLLAARVTPSSSPGPSRTNSLGSLGLAVTSEEAASDRTSASSDWLSTTHADEQPAKTEAPADGQARAPHGDRGERNATEPSFLAGETKEVGTRTRSWHLVPKRVAATIINSIRWVLSTLVSPGVYLIACFYDEDGTFAPFVQLKKLFGFGSNPSKLAVEFHADQDVDEKTGLLAGSTTTGSSYGGVHTMSSAASSSAISSESESDIEHKPAKGNRGSGSRRAQSRSSLDSEEISPARRSIRIKLHSDESLRQRKKKAQNAGAQSKNGSDEGPPDISAQLKSPTSPVGALTKYPRTPAPPRPLIPRRQPSYLNLEPVLPTHQKTLILDLDETLIHSMSKGGRMSSGHMVEVRLTTTIPTVGGQTMMGPQHPILYYVHKRPHCDDFLRRVRQPPMRDDKRESDADCWPARRSANGSTWWSSRRLCRNTRIR